MSNGTTRFDGVIALVTGAGSGIGEAVVRQLVDDPETKKLMTDAIVSNEPIDVSATLTDAQRRRLMSVDADGTFRIVRAAVRAMKPTGGAIVVIGSSSVFNTLTGSPHYVASKSAVHAFGRSVAKEVLAFGIRVQGPIHDLMVGSPEVRSAGVYRSRLDSRWWKPSFR